MSILNVKHLTHGIGDSAIFSDVRKVTISVRSVTPEQ